MSLDAAMRASLFTLLESEIERSLLHEERLIDDFLLFLFRR